MFKSTDEVHCWHFAIDVHGESADRRLHGPGDQRAMLNLEIDSVKRVGTARAKLIHSEFSDIQDHLKGTFE